MASPVVLKGYRGTVRALLDARAEWVLVRGALEKTLQQSGNFLKGAQLVLELGSRPLTRQVSNDILELLEGFPLLTVKGILSGPDGHGARYETPRLYRGTLRNGQELRHQGDLVILGDVNSGARAIASGDVVVVGALRGIAQAGSGGDRQAIIYAGEFRPTQVRIADLIAVDPGSPTAGPELAMIDGNSILVESWRQANLPARRTDQEGLAQGVP